MFDWEVGEVLVGGLAAFRLWWLIAKDTILDVPRRWVAERSPRVAGLLACAWCAGFWVSVFVFVAAVLWGDGAWFQVGALILAVSAVVGVAAAVVDRTYE